MKKQLWIATCLSLIVLTILACNLSQNVTPTVPAAKPTAEQPPAPTIKVIMASPTAETLAPSAPDSTPTMVPTATVVQNGSALDGKALVQERCTVCHGLKQLQRKHSADQWKMIVDDMIDKGAQLNGDEEIAVINYLAGN